MKPLVYIAGPYTNPDPVENTRNAIAVGDILMDGNLVTPLVPHLTMFWHYLKPRHIDEWYEYDLELLARCDAVLRLPGASVGADREVAEAHRLMLRVFDDIEDVHAWARSLLEPES